MCRIQRHRLQHFLDLKHAQRRSLHKDGDVTDLIGVCPCATASFRITPTEVFAALGYRCYDKQKWSWEFYPKCLSSTDRQLCHTLLCNRNRTGSHLPFKIFNQRSKCKAEKVKRKVNTQKNKTRKMFNSPTKIHRRVIYFLYLLQMSVCRMSPPGLW